MTPQYIAEIARAPEGNGIASLIRPGETNFYSYELLPRYGRLAAGHYSLLVRHPHPTTGAMLVSNAIEFDIPRP